VDGTRITPVPHQTLVRVFETVGFAVARKRGDHLILTRPGAKRPLVIKTSHHNVPVTHILSNLRSAGMTRKEYLEILDRIA
jgi:predicted RNA binding protein YcfA (HicA-like mRNA interferase family)